MRLRWRDSGWVSSHNPILQFFSGGIDDHNRLGAFLGPTSQAITDLPLEASIPASDLRTGQRCGERFASIVRHWRGEGSHVTERVEDLATAAALRAARAGHT